MAGRRKWILLTAGLLSLAAGAALLGRGAAARLLCWTASHAMTAGDLSRAESRLLRAARLDPDSYRPALLLAACSRRLGEMDAWSEALERARAQGAPAGALELEQRLGSVQSGKLEGGVEREIADLVLLGATSDDLAAAIVLGLLARGDLQAAGNFLNAGLDPKPTEAQFAYLWGVYWRHQGGFDEAESRLTRALAAAPAHEPARAELAALMAQQGHRLRAVEEYSELVARSGGRESVVLELARALRQLGRFADARRVLASVASQDSPSNRAAMQIAEIECDLGNYQEAGDWLERLRPQESMDSVLITLAARICSLEGKTLEAERLFDRVAALSDRALVAMDLQQHLSEHPGDRSAARQLQTLYGTPLPPTDLEVLTPVTADGSATADSRAAELYARHCGACHGSTGDGRGRAGRHLFPRPRDLRNDESRLVSTRNGVPTPGDWDAVLRRGMPGTSMPAFDELRESDRNLLLGQIVEFRREGVREQLVRSMRMAGDDVDEEDVEAAVEQCTSPGERIEVPGIFPTGGGTEGDRSMFSANVFDVKTPELAEKWTSPRPPRERLRGAGAEKYQQLGCNKCHGDDGRGGTEPAGFDRWGYPVRPRDLAREPMKGGQEPESIYLRLAAGMPGTAHPAVVGLSPDELAVLAFYVQSLGKGQELALTNHERWAVAEPDAYRAASGPAVRGGESSADD